MFQEIFIVFVTVFVADIGDKTQLTIIILTHKTQKHLLLLLGVMSGFFLGNLLSIIAGTFISHILPGNTIKILSGIVFIIFGFLTWRSHKEEANQDTIKSDNPFWSGLSLVFLSEFGDKSQIATALFATKYPAVLVLAGSMAGLFLISVLTIYLSKKVFSKMNPRILSLAAGLIFIIIGILFIV